MTRINTLRQTIGGRFTPEELANALGYENFSPKKDYVVGEKVFRSNKFWIFKSNHAKGAWNAQHVELYNIDADMESIKMKIPAEASNENQLADKEYVNQGISTATATFRGTFNLVSDLELTTSASEEQIAAALASKVATKDNNDYCFVQIPTDSETPTEIRRIDRYKFNGTNFAFEFELNNTGFTKNQWKAINSGITSTKVAKLNDLPTANNLYTKEEADETFAKPDGYYAGMAVGLADNLRGNVYADEQFAVRMTGGEANEVGGIGVVQVLKGAGAAIVQMFPEGANHDFSGDVSLDGTGGNAEAVVRYTRDSTDPQYEMGYLLAMEAFVSQTLTQAQLDAISAKDTGKADRDKAVWLTPAGAMTSAPTIESGQTEVTFSGWRIAMRVKASEVRDASASGYWFTSGTAGRQVFDVAVAEGIDLLYPQYGPADWNPFILANGWNTKSAMEYLQHMAAQGLPTHQVKAMSALLAVTKIGIKTVKSRNLLNPQTGRALLKAYVNDDETYLDNEYTMLGGLPSGSTMAFTSLLTGKTETLTMLDSTHFVIPSDGWLQITGTLPESIIATWNGEKDNTAADEYATESHVWDVTQLFGTKDGGTEGHYYRFAKEGMRGAGTAQDVVELVGARGTKKIAVQDLGNLSYVYDSSIKRFSAPIETPKRPVDDNSIGNYIIQGYALISLSALFVNKESDKLLAKPFSNDYIAVRNLSKNDSDLTSGHAAWLEGVMMYYELADAAKLHFTSLFLSASSTSDELTAMPADAIPLSEIQFADNNWSIEEAVFDAPEADANGVITPTAVTGQMRIQYSLDAAEQIDTLQKEYAALEARVTALENA